MKYEIHTLKPIALLSNEHDGKVLQIDTDHLGTPRAVTDKDNSTVWKWEGDAFGSQSPQIATVKMPLRMAGQYADDESGLFYNEEGSSKALLCPDARRELCSSVTLL